MDLTDQQWQRIAHLIPGKPGTADRRGRPRRSERAVLNGIFWVLRNRLPWKDLPDRYPSFQTCNRRFLVWLEDGTFERVVAALITDLGERGRIAIAEYHLQNDEIVREVDGAEHTRIDSADTRRSWQWQTLLLLLSPAMLRSLKRKESPLLDRYSEFVRDRVSHLTGE